MCLLLIVLNRYIVNIYIVQSGIQVIYSNTNVFYSPTIGSMTDKRHGMVNYVGKVFCNNKLTAVKSIVVN